MEENKKPKFNIMDKVFIIDDNKVIEKTIGGIHVKWKKQRPSDGIGYDYEFDGFIYNCHYDIEKYGWINEERIFSTKEELIASL